MRVSLGGLLCYCSRFGSLEIALFLQWRVKSVFVSSAGDWGRSNFPKVSVRYLQTPLGYLSCMFSKNISYRLLFFLGKRDKLGRITALNEASQVRNGDNR